MNRVADQCFRRSKLRPNTAYMRLAFHAMSEDNEVPSCVYAFFLFQNNYWSVSQLRYSPEQEGSAERMDILHLHAGESEQIT